MYKSIYLFTLSIYFKYGPCTHKSVKSNDHLPDKAACLLVPFLLLIRYFVTKLFYFGCVYCACECDTPFDPLLLYVLLLLLYVLLLLLYVLLLLLLLSGEQVRQTYAQELRTRTEMELLLRKCVEDVRRAIVEQ